MSDLFVNSIKSNTDANNHITVESGHSLIAPGHVIQTLDQTQSTTTTTSSTSFVTTGLSVTITPKKANSKILITTSGTSYCNYDDLHQYHTIYRGSTHLAPSAQGFTLFSAGSNSSGRWSNSGMTYVDSPNTTSAVTYTIYFRCSNSSGTASFVHNSNHPHRMVVQEIAQ